MTHRTDNAAKSPIEHATEEVVTQLNASISVAFRMHPLPVNERQFRRIIALYFERQTITEWCHMLGIEPTSDDIDASRSQT